MNRRTALCVVPVLALLLVAPAVRAGDPVALISQEAVLQRQQQQDAALVVVDVRTPGEYAQGHVPGALNLPHDQVASRVAELPRDKDLVLYCRSGRRVELAAEALRAAGYTRLLHLEGDMPAWVERGRPVENP